MYGLPKIHKLDVPFRPIVCSVQSITHELCSYLKSIIQPVVGKRESAVRNCKNFVEQIRLFEISPSDILVSYDVKDLFTSVPISYTFNVLQELLYADDSLPQRTKLSPFQIVQLASFCMLEGNFFHFQGRFYRQEGGAPMGSPLSPVLAEVFMEHLEGKAFSEGDKNILPRLFKRYVDDIFVMLESGKEEAFLNYLNSLFPDTISFTIEKEMSGKLPFLDPLIIRTSGQLKTTVYRKPTHSNRHLHFSSHHPRAVMKGIIRDMVKRALDLCEPEFLREELHHIHKTLEENGYPSHFLRSVMQETIENSRRVHRNGLPGPRILLPYYKGLSGKIQTLGRRLQFSVCYKRGQNLRSLLRTDKVKLPIDKLPGVIYEVKCSCSASYIGETGFTLADRFSQHIKNLTCYNKAIQELEGTNTETAHRGRPPSLPPLVAMERALAASAVAEHAAHCSGSLQTRIICKEPQLTIRRIKEALYIQHNTTINRDNGVEVSNIWNNLINTTSCCSLE
ncbi:hypothetical protein M513_13237 [Trichuris suis]|uniref:Reverse transcriptase domain-containing protein n=1 Tax=Trichuris suis TaxID=68888 RepID=A0A085LLQ3_9BILA|nr:hypothetical protein M513_13237 [Trichuris suis]